MDWPWGLRTAKKRGKNPKTRSQNTIYRFQTLATIRRHSEFSQFMSLVWSWWVNHHSQGVSRPYRGCLDRFMWLFYHFVKFYGLKHPKIRHRRSWWSSPKYWVYDQNFSIMGYVPCIWGVPRPYRGCLDRFMWLGTYFLILSGFMVQNIRNI